MARYEELTIDKGTDVSIDLQLTNVDGSVKDLTGYWVAAKLAETYTARDSDKISFDAYVTVPPSDGNVNLTLTSAVTEALNTRRKYVYDVEIAYQDSDENVIIERILEGIIKVTPSVT